MTTLAALWLPLFTIGRSRGAPSYSLWDLREAGAPGIPLLFLGAIVLAADAITPDRLRSNSIQIWLAGLALAEAIGTVVALALGFSLVRGMVSSTEPAITFHPGLLVLIVGITATVIGSWHQRLADTHASGPRSRR
ncbi:hypothetical protein [Nocardia sp. SSK8]|uniref:hypothetical protein n=1 Tax=Nocardia sp. SSK8 TaxID=3120154 RepID=UPI00300BDE04